MGYWAVTLSAATIFCGLLWRLVAAVAVVSVMVVVVVVVVVAAVVAAALALWTATNVMYVPPRLANARTVAESARGRRARRKAA